MTDKKIEPETKSERCPKCDGPFVLLRTLFKKVCAGCNTKYEWLLKKNQKPLL